MYRYNIFRNFSKKFKKSKKRVWILATVATILIAFGIWMGVNLSPRSSSTDTEKILVRQGMSVEAIADLLYQKELIRDPFAFSIWSWLSGSGLQAGEHLIAPSYSVPQIVNMLRSATSDEISVIIPPGLSLEGLRSVFRDYGWTDSEISIAFNAEYTSKILRDKPFGASLEGYIYPDTYNVFIGQDLSKLIQKAIDNMYDKVISDGLWVSETVTGRTFFDTLILASIVEKEVSDPSERKMVAGILINRLENGWRLDADATFRYAFNNNLCLINGPGCDSKYNTRLYVGLPPGPISNASLSAIESVIHPTSSGFFYYLSGDDGKARYAVTIEQHNQNIANYCQVNCAF